MSFIKAIDMEHLKQIAKSGGARRIKREWIKKGYINQLSLYGVITNSETQESYYCRIEVLSNTAYNQRIVFLLYQLFYELKPNTSYTIWIYDKDRDSVKVIGRYR